MKRIFVLTILCCSFFVVNAATFVSGIIASNTIWTKVNSPYVVNGDLSIDSGYTLIIQPGVEVRVDSNRVFQIDGRLIADGTVTDSIIFTSNATNPKNGWPGLSFRIKARNDTSRFSYCRVEYAAMGIYNAGTSLLVNKSVFRGCRSAAIYLTTPSLPNTCYNAIDRCLITENDKGVWDSQNTINPGSFTYNDVTYNTIGYFSQSSSNGMVTTNNNFSYNQTGVSLQGGNVRGLRFNTFKGSSFAGLSVVANTIYTPVSNNLFIYNENGMWLADVNTGNINNNTIAYNNVGIMHMQNPVNLPTPSGMNISSNCFTKNVLFNFKETSTIDYAATNNWWGDTAIAHIDSFIYDHYDSVAMGTVSYLPIQTSGSGCQTVTPPPPCMAPQGLAWGLVLSYDCIATWQKVAGAKEYEYYVRSITSPAPSAGVVTADTAIKYTSMAAGKTYIVCVRTRCWQQPFFSEWACDTVTAPTNITTLQQAPQLRIYPNPNNGVFTIDIPTGMQAGQAIVLDVNGRVIQSKAYTAGTKLQFDMKDAARGVYVVRFTAGTTTSHATMVVN